MTEFSKKERITFNFCKNTLFSCVFLIILNLLFYGVIIKQKGGKAMNKALSVFAKAAKKTAEHTLKRDANSTTCWGIYQPKAPTSLKEFSKFDK